MRGLWRPPFLEELDLVTPFSFSSIKFAVIVLKKGKDVGNRKSEFVAKTQILCGYRLKKRQMP